MGNIRDYAGINVLICLSNMESINALLIVIILCDLNPRIRGFYKVNISQEYVGIP